MHPLPLSIRQVIRSDVKRWSRKKKTIHVRKVYKQLLRDNAQKEVPFPIKNLYRDIDKYLLELYNKGKMKGYNVKVLSREYYFYYRKNWTNWLTLPIKRFFNV